MCWENAVSRTRSVKTKRAKEEQHHKDEEKFSQTDRKTSLSVVVNFTSIFHTHFSFRSQGDDVNFQSDRQYAFTSRTVQVAAVGKNLEKNF